MEKNPSTSNSIKKKGEIYSYFMAVCSQFFWAVSNIQLKTYRAFFPEDFSTQSLTFWRSLSICLIGYVMIKRKNERITPLNEIKK